METYVAYRQFMMRAVDVVFYSVAPLIILCALGVTILVALILIRELRGNK